MYVSHTFFSEKSLIASIFSLVLNFIHSLRDDFFQFPYLLKDASSSLTDIKTKGYKHKI